MTNSRLKRTHMAGTLTREEIGQETVLMGWVAKERNLGPLIFIDLRDTTGTMQVVVRKEDAEAMFHEAEQVRSEFVIAVKGLVRERESINPNIPTGEIEVIADTFQILDRANTPPIYVRDDDNVSETMRLKYRFLELRKPYMQANLKLRARTSKVIRDFLFDNRFVEIETPYLTKPTPEGARDYLVPSRVNPHKFYALPQSPQLMKQMLMISGMDRYYQIVRCFRDEDLRANRQPEFTQVDIEMSFVDVEDVLDVNEKLIAAIFKQIKGYEIQLPIRRMSYQEAMESYGVDKPDLRFGMELRRLEDVFEDTDSQIFRDTIEKNGTIRGIGIGDDESHFSRKKIDKLTNFVKDYGAGGLIWVRFHDGEVSSSISKFLTPSQTEALKQRFDLTKNGLIFIVSDSEKVTNDALGNLRVHIANELGYLDPKVICPVWILDFPLFEYDEEEQRFMAKHHPFTHPHDDDIELLETAPEKARAKAYDIVINGDEIGGGSIRINNAELQSRMFNALQLSKEDIELKFGFFLEALKYGTPPHGGIAYGLDRLMMLLSETDNIKDVIAFPKTQSATCLLTEAPTTVNENQLAEIHIQLDESN